MYKLEIRCFKQFHTESIYSEVTACIFYLNYRPLCVLLVAWGREVEMIIIPYDDESVNLLFDTLIMSTSDFVVYLAPPTPAN